MKQKFTILFDLDGTLVDTAPDLMLAHNHVMKKFGYPTKSTDEIRNLVGQGAGAMLGRSIAKCSCLLVQTPMDIFFDFAHFKNSITPFIGLLPLSIFLE